jgi:hypothetical protein
MPENMSLHTFLGTLNFNARRQGAKISTRIGPRGAWIKGLVSLGLTHAFCKIPPPDYFCVCWRPGPKSVAGRFFGLD